MPSFSRETDPVNIKQNEKSFTALVSCPIVTLTTEFAIHYLAGSRHDGGNGLVEQSSITEQLRA